MDSIRERIVTALDCPVGPQGNLLEPDEAALARLWITRPDPLGGGAGGAEGDGRQREGAPSGPGAPSGNGSAPPRRPPSGGPGAGDPGRSPSSPPGRGAGRGAGADPGGRRVAVREGIHGAGPQRPGGGRGAHAGERTPGHRRRAPPPAGHRAPGEGRHSSWTPGTPGDPPHLRLLGFGADAIHPWLVRESSTGRWRPGAGGTERRWRRPTRRGLRRPEGEILKVMAKMGISTLSSYKGAQIFEALGLGPDVIQRCFARTESRIGGASLRCWRRRPGSAMPRRGPGGGAPVPVLDVPGEFSWRRGERTGSGIRTPSPAPAGRRQNSREAYRDFSRLCHEEGASRATLRSLLASPRTATAPCAGGGGAGSRDRERFSTGAMSYGALSLEAHETLAIAMNRVGGRSNSGEGGEDPGGPNPSPTGTPGAPPSGRSRRGASGEHRVPGRRRPDPDQDGPGGAKPGEGGQLPGKKVSAEMPRVRGTTPGVMLISPRPTTTSTPSKTWHSSSSTSGNQSPGGDRGEKLVSVGGGGDVAAGVPRPAPTGSSSQDTTGGPARPPSPASATPASLGAGAGRDRGDPHPERAPGRGAHRGGRAPPNRAGVRLAALPLGADSFGFSTHPSSPWGAS